MPFPQRNHPVSNRSHTGKSCTGCFSLNLSGRVFESYFKLLAFHDAGDSRLGYLHPGFPDYRFAPGARTHLHVPGVTEGRGSVFKADSAGTPLNAVELKV